MLDILMGVIQRISRKVEIWCTTISPPGNPRKNEFIVFTRRSKWNRGCSFSMNGKKLQLSSEYQYLEVTVNSKLF